MSREQMATTMLGAPAVAATPRLAGGLRGRGTRGLGILRYASAYEIARLMLALVILGPSCLADTIRVISWNLESVPAAGTNDTRIQDSAGVLKQLNPDVILAAEQYDHH